MTVKVSGGPGNTSDWVGLYAVGAADTSFVTWQYLNGSQTAPASGATSATLTFAMPSTAGSYEFRFFANNGYTLLAKTGAVTVAVSGPAVTASPSSVGVGAPVAATVSGGPGNTSDWVGAYAVGAADTSFLSWQCRLCRPRASPPQN